MSHDDVLASHVKHRQAQVDYFSPANKPERERWVVAEFLTNLGISFESHELQFVSDEPPDIRFRDAAFEVKEILDAGRRRHAEIKESVAEARAAESPMDLLRGIEPRDLVFQNVWKRLEEEVARLVSKYSTDTRAVLDVLFYVNLQNALGHVPSPYPPSEKWLPAGFRSISFVIGRFSGVAFASQIAPQFLRDGGVRLVPWQPRDQK